MTLKTTKKQANKQRDEQLQKEDLQWASYQPDLNDCSRAEKSAISGVALAPVSWCPQFFSIHIQGITFHFDDHKTNDDWQQFHFKFSTIPGPKYPEFLQVQDH